MSAIPLILLATAGTAVGLGVAALHTARGLRADLAALRAEVVAEVRAASVPAARPVPAREIRDAVAEALAAERERELAEARAYWAEQEARACREEGEVRDLRGVLGDPTGVAPDSAARADEELLDALLERYLLSDSGFAVPGHDGVFVPSQTGAVPEEATAEDAADGAAPADDEATDRERVADAADVDEPDAADADDPDEPRPDAAELAAARRRHPSHPGYTLTGEPVGEAHQRTAARLAELAEARTPLAEVRPGPLGTLDVFLFADGTTLCLSPSHRQAAEQLAAAVRDGEPPVLMGGSGISGAYALTFSCGDSSVFLLADRVVATSGRRR